MAEFIITHKIEAPDLVAALNNLAEALRNRTTNDFSGKPNNAPSATEKPVESSVDTPAWIINPTVEPAMETVTSAGTVTATDSSLPMQPPSTANKEQSYTLEKITDAGSALLDAGKMDALMALLAQYGVQAITQLKPEQYADIAVKLRALGANI